MSLRTRFRDPKSGCIESVYGALRSWISRSVLKCGMLSVAAADLTYSLTLLEVGPTKATIFSRTIAQTGDVNKVMQVYLGMETTGRPIAGRHVICDVSLPAFEAPRLSSGCTRSILALNCVASRFPMSLFTLSTAIENAFSNLSSSWSKMPAASMKQFGFYERKPKRK